MFLSDEIRGHDTEIISRDESYKVPETACAFANSSGGVIVCENSDALKLIPDDIPYRLEDCGVYVPPLVWHKKPALYRGRVYRRIEGQNIISGKNAKIIMAGDAHDYSRDDYPVKNVLLCEKSINEFHMKVTRLNEGLRRYSRGEVLRRAGAYSGEFLTLAGALMFGDVLRVNALLDYDGGNAEIEARNIWDAYTMILPRITAPLSSKCATAFREVFINSLLHADYNADNHVNFVITSDPPKVFADNPGTIRGTVRNHRLAKMFMLSGLTERRKSHGLNIIREFMPSFTLEEDMLELRTSATLVLEGKSILPEAVML